MKKRLILYIICILPTLAMAQQRPRVGLALSGGGAKSMAQLGALRVIEQSGIQIDYISGTSMGAIIGAMYSMGYTVDEIEYYLSIINWDALLSNDIPRDRLPYLNRNDEKYLLSFEIYNRGLNLPKAFNYGHYMLKQLSFLTMRFHDKADFSELAIPFVCVATDLETGEMVFFDKGNLTDALRATVAYPSIFSPHEINGRLYVDGGVRNNMPIAILKEEKGMDYVIAIDVQGALYKQDELNGIIEVMEQIGSFPNMIYFDEQKILADILIRPAIDEFSITDYQATDTILARGYRAALEKIDEFKVLAEKQNTEPQRPAPKTATPLYEFWVDSVHVAGVLPKQAQLVQGKLRLKPDEMYTLAKLDKGLDMLYGSARFDKVVFQYNKMPDGKMVANIAVKPKRSNQSTRFGLHYDDDFSIALLANYTARDVLFLNSKFISEVAISENPRGSISYVLEKGFVPALGTRISFWRFQPRVYMNGDPLTQFSFFTYNVDVFLHSTLFNNYTIGTGFKWEDVSVTERIPIVGLESRSQFFIYHAFLDFDSYNRSFKPQYGLKLSAKFNVISGLVDGSLGDPTSVSSITFDKAIKFTKKNGMKLGFTGAATIGGSPEYPYQVFVGGLGQNYINFTFPFVGYRHMELIGRNFGAIRADFYQEFGKNHYLSFKTNFGKLEPTVDDLFNSQSLLDGYGLSYAYNSPIGPLELTVMSSTNHSRIFTYINLGFWF